MTKYRPAVSDFLPKRTIDGIFTYVDGNRGMQFSQINGQPIFVSANYQGGSTGFGRGAGIENGARVSATIAEIKTRTGIAWIPLSIKEGNRLVVSRSPEELNELWLSASRQTLFFRCLFIFLVFVAPYLIITGMIEYGRS